MQANDRRTTTEIDGDFVIFLIGMRINNFWKVHKWLPVLRAMRPMIRELEQRPESGFLGHTFGWPVIVQYWRSFDHLEAYARSHNGLHWPAWVAFNKRMHDGQGGVGIWHETFRVTAGQYEAIYWDMPPFGLSAFGRRIPLSTKRESARARLGSS